MFAMISLLLLSSSPSSARIHTLNAKAWAVSLPMPALPALRTTCPATAYPGTRIPASWIVQTCPVQELVEVSYEAIIAAATHQTDQIDAEVDSVYERDEYNLASCLFHFVLEAIFFIFLFLLVFDTIPVDRMG